MGTLPSSVIDALHLELLVQLALAVVLGGLIGFEREWRGKPAGLRTNILICMAAVVFAQVSQRAAQHGGDPGRIAAQVLTGVGFLGAGTILHQKGAITGLTSAATIWIVTAIGVTLGFGAYLDAVGATILVLVVLAGLPPLERLIRRRQPPVPAPDTHPTE
jgi:putative Mg2+ transporter-C (MgtC) family protein